MHSQHGIHTNFIYNLPTLSLAMVAAFISTARVSELHSYRMNCVVFCTFNINSIPISLAKLSKIKSDGKRQVFG